MSLFSKTVLQKYINNEKIIITYII